MKKSKIIALASAVSLTAAAVFAATSMASAAPALGDVDCNGKVTASDARMILRHSAKLENLSDSVIPVADADGNGKVSATDARLVLRFASKLISTMGGEDKYAEFIKSNESSDTSPTTKKTDSSDLSTRPVTRPTTKPAAELSTKPTTAPTTAPTTEPTTVPTTAPTTEPTTAPTTAPTTEPTTVPTTAPTTEPTTAEPTTKPGYDDNIPAAIHSFTNGKFDFVGTIVAGGGKQNVRFTNDGERMRISMKADGMDLDLLKLIGKKTLLNKDGSEYYIVSDSKKAYCKLDKASMSLLGMKESDFAFTFATIDISKSEYTVEVTSFNGKDNVTCYVFTSDGAKLNFYMDGDTLIGMENCDSAGNIQQMIIFDSFTGDVPASRWSLDGYSKKSLMELAVALVK